MLFWLMQIEIPEFVQANGNLLTDVFFFGKGLIFGSDPRSLAVGESKYNAKSKLQRVTDIQTLISMPQQCNNLDSLYKYTM
jgi:hypothetical protein